VVLVALAAAVLLAIGWKTFRFVCDDAYITFRYASSRRAGWGYAYNPPPFHPVEGYTSFLWLVLVDLLWSVTGKEPPATVSGLSLAFAFGSLGLVVAMTLRLRLSARLAPARLPLLALVLAGVVSNRTFLAWSSSGLETPLFVFLVLGWVYLGLFVPRETRARAPALAIVTSLLALCRPDGLLFALATAILLATEAVDAKDRSARWAGAFAPIGVVAIHLALRRAYYGDWLPNTYYAKVGPPWPSAGTVYVASFLLEYGYAVWLFVVGIATWRAIARGGLGGWWSRRPEAVVVVATLVAHAAYYALLVGGDHFEFRVFAHLVPLIPLSLVALADGLSWTRARVFLLLGLMTALGLPIPWIHWAEARTDQDWAHLKPHPVAKYFPFGLRAYAAAWDASQAYLNAHLVCIRHHEHKAFAHRMRRVAPSRELGATIPLTDHPVGATGSIGIVAWSFPNVAFIDTFGLNDRVVAHTPLDPGSARTMAHERKPPPGYVECFRPNLLDTPAGIKLFRRPQPLTSEEIIACEERFAVP
jgi:arabinofuranosyltransferase